VVPKNHVTTPDFSALAATPKSDCEFEDGTMLARADGQVFVSGAFCAPDRATAVAWWRPGGAPARLVYAKGYRFLEIQEFVDAGTAGVFVVAAAVPDGVTAKTTLPFLGHFEDGSWAPVQLPFEDAAVESGIEVHAAHDGTLWVLANGTLFRRGTDAAWAKELAADSVLFIEGKPSWATVGGKRRVAHRMPDGTWHESGLPAPAFAKDEELLAESIQVDAHGEPWVRATYADAVDARRDRVAILRYESATTTHRPSAVWCSAERDVALGAWPALAGEACATPLPVLLRISRNAPETVDFPSVRKALAAAAVPEGVDLVEVTLANQRVLAAKVPSMAVGRSVVSAVEEGVEYSSPQLVCADAPVRRVLPPLAKGTSGAVSKGKTQ